MKQTYILTSLLCLTVLLMPGCTSPIGSGDDPSPSTLAINFGTPQADTRAAVSSSTDMGDFSVWGGYDGNASNVFSQVTVHSPGWTYDGGTRYWISGKTYNFYAVHPAGLNASVDDSGTITVNDFDCSKTGKDAVDLMTATATGLNGSEAPMVGLKFGHELARVNVVATVEGGDATVTNIVFAGMATKGDFSSSAEWSVKETGSFTNPTDQTLNTEGVDLLGDMLLIPQAVSEDFTLTVDYSVGGVAQPQKVITLPTTISQWDKGKSYKYTLSFKRNTLTVIVKVVDWKEEDTSVSWG